MKKLFVMCAALLSLVACEKDKKDETVADAVVGDVCNLCQDATPVDAGNDVTAAAADVAH